MFNTFNEVSLLMPGKNRLPDESGEMFAGKRKKAYTGEKLERLKKAAESVVRRKLTVLRHAEVDSASEVGNAAIRYIGTGGKLSYIKERALKVALVRAQLRHHYAMRDYSVEFLEMRRKFGGLLEFDEKSINRAVRRREYCMRKINRGMLVLNQLLSEERGRKNYWKRTFERLRMKIFSEYGFRNKNSDLARKVRALKPKANAAAKKYKEDYEFLIKQKNRDLADKEKNPEDVKKKFSKNAMEIQIKLLEARLDLAEANEKLQLFWWEMVEHFNDQLALSEDFIEEIGRRLSSAKDRKIKIITELNRLRN